VHELGITQEILSTALKAAKEAGGEKINDVTISVGELTEVVEFALQFNWDVITQDTIAEGATLTVNMIAPRSHCRQCDTEYDHDKWDFTCPECGNMLVDTVAGRELQIDSIDIETPDEKPDG
jgi:hydrogenase nickel incorporation protein HypA/HybF